MLLNGYLNFNGVFGGTIIKYQPMNKTPSMKGVQTRTLNILELLAKHADGLALAAIELVRLSVGDSERLTWVARAQGARQGLRYDPDMGTDARFSCSSTG